MICGSTGVAAAATAAETQAAFVKTGDYLYRTTPQPTFSSIGGEWVIYGLANAGYEMSDAYLAAYQRSRESSDNRLSRGTGRVPRPRDDRLQPGHHGLCGCRAGCDQCGRCQPVGRVCVQGTRTLAEHERSDLGAGFAGRGQLCNPTDQGGAGIRRETGNTEYQTGSCRLYR